MASDLILGSEELAAAMAILAREQAAYQPTAWQNRLFRAFNLAAYLLAAVVALGLSVAVSPASDFMSDDNLIAGYFLFAAVLSLAVFVLFLTNIGLILKFYNHARLRRRLRLANVLKPAFRAGRRTGRLTNALTIAISVLGIFMVLATVLTVFILAALSVQDVFSSTAERVAGLFTLLAWMSICLGLASLHFMRRGKQRLEIVNRLQDTLSNQPVASAVGGGAPVSVTPEDYALLAGMEREQIIKDRASSIIAGRKEAKASSFSFQASRQMSEAKSQLSGETLAKVEAAVLDLLSSPEPADATVDPVSGYRTVAVPGTALGIRYEVDQARSLIRLHDLIGAVADASVHAGGRHGLS